MTKLVVFDWDGTLADSIENIIQCKQFLAKKYGFPSPSAEKIKKVLGIEFTQAMKTCFPDSDDLVFTQVCKDYHSLMTTPKYQSNLYKNVDKTLLKLKNSGCILAVASSKEKKGLLDDIIRHKLNNMFNLVCSGNEHQGKPSPDMLIEIMSYCSVGKKNTIMVGDTLTDVEFAKNASIASVAVTYGAQSRKTLENAMPTFIINDISELTTILKVQ